MHTRGASLPHFSKLLLCLLCFLLISCDEKEALRNEYLKDQGVIIVVAKIKITNGDFAGAYDDLYRYRNVAEDKDFRELFVEAAEGKIKSVLAENPDTETSEILESYRHLVELRPNEKKYLDKVAFYERQKLGEDSGEGWNYTRELDDFSDAIIHIARTKSSLSGSYIAVRCDENLIFDTVISTGDYIGDSGQSVRYRIDNREPHSGRWNASTEGTSVFAGDASRRLAWQMTAADSLAFEVTDFAGTQHKAKFSLTYSANAIGKVLEACNTLSKEVKVDGIEQSVTYLLSGLAGDQIICSKKMLSSLGYSISDMTETKTPDVYRAYQEYADDKFSKYLISNQYYRCESPLLRSTSATDFWGFSKEPRESTCRNKYASLGKQLYADAVQKDSSFGNSCRRLIPNE